MSDYSSIQKSVIALYRAGAKRIVLDEIKARPPIAAKTGTALASAYSFSSLADGVRRECITVYSHLIITADGAFERPLGWPSDGSYPAGAVAPSPAVDSIEVVGSTVKLKTDIQYYEQKRTHLVVFEQGDTLVEDQLLIKLAAPFGASNYYQGINRFSPAFAPALFMTSVPSPTAAIAAKIATLTAAGVVAE